MVVTRMPNQGAIQSSHWVNARHSQRVVLRVRVLVRAQFENESSFISEESHTLVVSVRGALIVLAMAVEPGQTLVLRNCITGEEQQCSVVHVGEKKADKSEVGIAFAHPAPRFWQIDFPPADWKVLLD
jgi:hypothetical protein